jgi:hypothetical protein
MTTVIITLCLCSSFTASLGFGVFSQGVIPGTEPHYLKVIQVDRAKKVFDPIKPVIQEFKDKFMEPNGGGQKKEGVTREDVKSFVEEKIGKEKCGLILREINEVKKLTKIESDKPPRASTVFSLSGNKEKNDIFYDYMNVTEKDFELGSEMCDLIKS